MANIESKYTLDAKSVLDGLDQIIAKTENVDLVMTKLSKTNPFKDIAKSGEQLDRSFSENLNGIVKSEATLKSYNAEVRRLGIEQAKVTKGQKELTDSIKYDKVKIELERVRQKLGEVSKQLAETTKKGEETSGALGKLGGFAGKLNTAFQAFIGLKAVQYIYDIGKSVFDTSAKFEKYGKILETALGSQALSNQAMEALKKIAAETAFSMDELTNGYVKMVNRGLRPSTQEIIKLTDLAASQGKSFDQLVEAVLDAQTGEFERLKEFGIKAKKTGEDVSLAFKGQTAAVKNNEKAIYEAIVAMGAINGVAGQNAELMGALDGKVSNLGDSVDNLSVKFGKVLKPVFDGILSGLSGGVNILGSIITSFSQWTGITDKTESSLSALNAQQKLTFDSEKKLKPLIARYDELKGKTVLNKTEQEELRKVIAEIQKIVPQAATAFDTYGKALDINKGKVQDYLISQGKLTKEMKQLAAENISKDLEDLAGKQQVLNRELAQGFLESYENGVRSERKLTNEQIVERQISLAKIKEQTIKLRRALRGLDGLGVAVGELPTEGGSTTPGVTGPDEKTLLARKKALEDAEKDLQNALLKLEEQYGKDQLEAMKGNELERIRLKKAQDLEAIKREEEFFLKIKQIESGARKGMFNKDTNEIIPDKKTTLTEAEKKPYDFRRGLVDDRATDETDAYYKSQAEKISEGEKNITELLSNEYQLQLQAIERKYEKALKLSEGDGKKRLELEKQKEEEIKTATLDKDLGDLDKQKDLEIQGAELSILQAQIDGRVDMELNARNQLLQIEKEYNEKKLKIIKASGVDDVNARILPIMVANKEIEKTQNDISKKIKDFSKKFTVDYWLAKIPGMDPEGIEAIHEASSAISQNVRDLYSTINQLSQERVSRIEAEISAKQSQVDAEKELSEKGVANNLDLKTKELADLKSQRDRALKDQQKAAKQQMIIETAVQTSSMISAAAKVFSSLAGLPFGIGVPLAIAAVAVMLGSFAAAKIKAFQLVKEQNSDKFEFGGRLKGPRHSEGGVQIAPGAEAEGGEWIINRKSSSKYDDVLEAINKNDDVKIMDYLLHEMIANTGVSMPEAEREKNIVFIKEHGSTAGRETHELITEVKALKSELQGIRTGTDKIPDEFPVPLGDDRYMLWSRNKTIIRTLARR